MGRSRIVAFALGIWLGTTTEAAWALPKCTTVSVVMLPGYTCTLGGLLFKNFLFDVSPPTVTATGAARAPQSYDLTFDLVSGRIVVTYVPAGEPDLDAYIRDDPGLNLPPPPFLQPQLKTAWVTFAYDVTVDPFSPYGLQGLSGAFGTTALELGLASSAPRTSTSGYFGDATVTQFLRASILGAGASGTRQSTTSNGVGTTRTFGSNTYGSNLSNSPLLTGSILPGQLPPGATFTVTTGSAVSATAALNASSAASANVGGQWSTTFTVTPEPSTSVLVATGLAALVGMGLLRRRIGLRSAFSSRGRRPH